MKLLTIISYLLLSITAFASDLYFGPTSAGSANGTSCANQFSFNVAVNGIDSSSKTASWTAVGAGGTIHLCGSGAQWIAVTGNGQRIVTTGGGGTAGNPITIKFETGTNLAAPYMDNQGGIRIGHSNITVDGGTNGQITNTLNGTPGFAGCLGNSFSGSTVCTQQQFTRMIYIVASSSIGNVEIKNLTIVNPYVYQVGSADNFPTNDSEEGVYFAGANHDTITLDHNTCHDVNHCVDGAGRNITISFNEIYNCGRCIIGGAPSSTVVNNWQLHDNLIHDINENAAGVHCDGIHIFPNSTGQEVDGLLVYNNYLYNPCSGGNTSFMYFEGSFGPAKLFNNLCILTASQADQCIETGNDGGNLAINDGWVVVNNTCVGGQFGPTSYACYIIGDATKGYTNLTWQNNIAILGGNTGGGNPAGLQSLKGTVGNPTTFISGGIDKNLYEDTNTDGGASQTFSYDGSSASTLTAWKALLPVGSGTDTNAVFNTSSNLKVSLTTGQLQSGSPGIGSGVNLTSLGVSALNCDKPTTVGPTGNGSCNTRPSVAAWDIGAYQFASTTATSPSCSPGTGTYNSTQSVTCTNPNSGTTVMCFTTNGTTPVTNGAGTGCTTGTAYTVAISVAVNETLKIVSGTSLLSDSAVVSYVYALQGSAPTFSPVGGVYASTQTVTISSAESLAMCFTTDGSTPTSNGSGACSHGSLVSGTVSVSVSETLKAIAMSSGWTDSGVGSATYTIALGSAGIGTGIGIGINIGVGP